MGGGGLVFEHEQPKGYSTNVRPRAGTQFGTMAGPGRYCKPRHEMPCNSRNGGSEC